jgi:hypothetical protein
MKHGEVPTKTFENRTVLPGWLDEGAPVRSLATFRSCITPPGGGGVYLGCDWAAKMRIPVQVPSCKQVREPFSSGTLRNGCLRNLCPADHSLPATIMSDRGRGGGVPPDAKGVGALAI